MDSTSNDSTGNSGRVELSTTPPLTISTEDECLICLQSTKARGGQVIMSPGCCGKFFHQKCIQQMLAMGNTHCPNCRSVIDHMLFGPPAPVHEFDFGLMSPRRIARPITDPYAPLAAPPITSPYAPCVRVADSPIPHPYARHQTMSSVGSLVGSTSPDIPPPAAAARLHHKSRGGRPPVHCDTEELLDRQPEAPTVAVAPEGDSAPTSAPTITLTTVAESTVVSLNDINSLFATVTLNASAAMESAARLPMDLVCVLDNSLSMSGSKIESVKSAMRFVRSQLGSDDRLSVVTFNSHAIAVHGLQRMTEAGKQASARHTDHIHAHDGTNIFDGLNTGVKILNSRRTKNPLSCVFLLTDGQDGSRMPEKQRLAASMKAKGQSLFVFGFGNDHDATELKMLADVAEGEFVFIEADTMVVDAFGGAIGGQQGTVATDLRLTLSIDPSLGVAAGVRLKQVYAGRYRCVTDASGQSAVVHFTNIFSSEQRDVLVELSLPATPEPVDRVIILSASAAYKNIDSTETMAIPASAPASTSTSISASAAATTAPAPAAATSSHWMNCVVDRHSSPSSEVSLEVDLQKNRLLTAAAMSRAMHCADIGDYEQAREVLESRSMEMMCSPSLQAGRAVALASLEDIREAETRVCSGVEYSRMGGKAAMVEAMGTQMSQRSTYSKRNGILSPYQTPRSYGMQSSACLSKGDL